MSNVGELLTLLSLCSAVLHDQHVLTMSADELSRPSLVNDDMLGLMWFTVSAHVPLLDRHTAGE